MHTQAPFINYVVCLGVLRGIQDAVKAVCPVSGDAFLQLWLR